MATTTSPSAVAIDIRAQRLAAKMTQTQLARAADCSLTFIGQVEAGVIPRRSETVPRILAVLAGNRVDDPSTSEAPAGNQGFAKTDVTASGHGL